MIGAGAFESGSNTTYTILSDAKRSDVIPAQDRVIVTRRPKNACRACQGAIVHAPAAARLIEGDLPTERPVALSSWRNMPIIARSIAPRPRSWRGRALRSIGAILAFWTGSPQPRSNPYAELENWSAIDRRDFKPLPEGNARAPGTL
jgi:hypothetical protein